MASSIFPLLNGSFLHLRGRKGIFSNFDYRGMIVYALGFRHSPFLFSSVRVSRLIYEILWMRLLGFMPSGVPIFNSLIPNLFLLGSIESRHRLSEPPLFPTASASRLMTDWDKFRADILSHFVFGGEDLPQFSQEAPINTDDNDLWSSVHRRPCM
jgi:hypothetical protein